MFTVGSGDPNVFCITAHPSERHFLTTQAAPMIGVEPDTVPIKGRGRVKGFAAPAAKAEMTCKPMARSSVGYRSVGFRPRFR